MTAGAVHDGTHAILRRELAGYDRDAAATAAREWVDRAPGPTG